MDQAQKRPLARGARRLAASLRSAVVRRVVLALVVAAAAACVVPAAGTARPLRTTDAATFARTGTAPAARIAPLSGALERYLEERAAPGAPAAPGSPAGGLVPAPVDFSHLSGAGAPAAGGAGLPSTYDLRPLRLGPVDDQGTYGTCWAFAALDSLESALLPADPQDFSEDNLVLTSGFDDSGDPYQTGGNALEAVAYLARWGGPLTAAEDVYGDAATPRGGLPVKHVQDVLFIPPRSGPLDNAGIKQAVMDYGAVYTVMYFGGPDLAYFNDATDAYYCWGEEPFDHAVTVVGWDDGYERGNFLAEPAGDGAFLVRNSWGDSFGFGGYFWVSYFDACIGSRLGPSGTTKENNDVNAVFVGAEPAGNFADVYQHDPLGWTDSLGFGSDTAWCAASYVARSDDPLVAVSFYTAALDSSYEVHAGLGDTARLSVRQAGSEPLPGYHTVRLDAPVPLTEGQTFTVAVKLVTPGYAFPVPLETNIEGYSGAATAAPGESWVSPDGVAWTDVTDPIKMPGHGSTSVCLKAFTRPVGPEDLTAPVTTVSGASAAWRRVPLNLRFDATDASLGSGVAFTQSKIGDADWQTGEQAVVRAPSTHANDGVHVVLYRSVDVAGNVETVKTCVARIDTRRPSVEAPRPCAVRRGGYATLRFRPRDARPSRGACRVVIEVRTRSRHLLMSFKPQRWYACGDLDGYRFRCPRSLARGDYRFSVTARDGAGNVSKAAANRLTVR